MRKLTARVLANIAGITLQGYHVKGVKLKRGPFTDSNHYGIILGKNPKGHYVTWQFHYDENEEISVYWGHYFMENREATIRELYRYGYRSDQHGGIV